MEVVNLTNFSVDTSLLARAVGIVTKRNISVALVEKEKMKELSRIYRGKDCVTDVLSFFYNEKDVLGEIVICPEKVKEDSKKDFTKEMCRVTIHGALHLLGYMHDTDEDEKLMVEKTEKYLQKLFD
jgi:probable rRNA maturation factor